MTSEKQSAPFRTINSLRGKSFNLPKPDRTGAMARALNVGHLRPAQGRTIPDHGATKQGLTDCV
jgi:hypothetical protein